MPCMLSISKALVCTALVCKTFKQELRSFVYNAQMREAVKDLDLRLVEVRATSSVEALVDECLKALS